MKKTQLGSVIGGTMQAKDLIPVFVAEIKYYNPRNKIACEIGKRINKKSYDYNSDLALYDLEALFDELNNINDLPYVYFGAHPGDGSDFGFWINEYFEYDFEGLKISDYNDIPKGYNGECLFINDYGNMTLYKIINGKKYEIWSIV